MKLTVIKEIKNLVDDEWREAVEQMEVSAEDFEVGNYRFIHENDIDQIMRDELEGDLYCLGCFNDWFLADVLGIDTDVITAMQEAEAFEAIGKLVISRGKLADLQAGYASADGYGHHFNGYDGGEENIGSYYVFRTD